jgi:hypothetical protein
MAETKKRKEDQLTYEQVTELARNLSEQNRQMEEYIKNSHTSEAIARLNFLFKVLEFSKHFDKDYVTKAVADIERILVMSEDVQGEPDSPVEE